MEFVDLETARGARGVRLVVLAGVPSPWSESAKGIFHIKGIPVRAVRLMPGDKALREWTRTSNAPVAIHDDEPPRSGWAEILDLAERLAPDPPLVPAEASARVRMFGLSHEVMGAGGLLWCARLMAVDASFASEGARGFPLPVAKYLGARYGYRPGCGAGAERRVRDALALLGDTLRAAGGPYYFGERLTALDVHSATAMNILAPPSEERCPMLPPIRAAFESMRSSLDGALPDELLSHRDRIYDRHLELPIVL